MNVPTLPAESAPSQRQQVDILTPSLRRHIEDALALAQYAVQSGATTKDGRSLSSDVLNSIHVTAAKLSPTRSEREESCLIFVKEWTDFELAYYRLAVFLGPITAETLRDTEGTSRSPDGPQYDRKNPFARARAAANWMADHLLGFSPAQRFARCLWLVAIGFALFVVWADWRLFLLGQEADATPGLQSYQQLLNFLTPWAYGGLGSCAFLLRSAHAFIYQRSFDLRRKPEYFNRILLGAISGGASILFMRYLLGDEGGPIQLSATALGFVAGYSTDFLFNTIERIVSAIFPKVALETVPTTPSSSLVDADLPTAPGRKADSPE